MTDLVCRRGPPLLTIAVMLARWNHCGVDPWLAYSVVSSPPAGLTAIVATQRSRSTRFISRAPECAAARISRLPLGAQKGPRSGTGNIGGLGLAMDGRVGQRLPSRAEYLKRGQPLTLEGQAGYKAVKQSMCQSSFKQPVENEKPSKSAPRLAFTP